MPIALSGQTPVWGEFPGETRNQFIDGLTTFLLKANWNLTARVKAAVTSSPYGSNFSSGNNITLAGIRYTFDIVLDNSTANNLLIGATLADSLNNFVAAVNAGSGSGTLYSTPTLPHPLVTASTTGTTVTITYRKAGPVGNGTSTDYGPLVYGGWKVHGTSPQTGAGITNPMEAHAYVYDHQVSSSGRVYAHTQIMNAAESVTSSEKNLQVVSGRRYRVVANRCQFFCYVAGSAANNFGQFVAAGVPWVPPASTCGGEVAGMPTSQSYWIVSDYDNSGNPPSTFRTVTALTAHYTEDSSQNTTTLTDAEGWLASEALFNANQLFAGSDPSGNFRMLNMTPGWNFQLDPSTTLIDGIKWFGGNGPAGRPMLLEPLVGWADTSSTQPARVRGQLWDAWIRTDQVPMDTVEVFDDGRTYVALSNLTKFGALWLFVPGPNPIQFEDLQASYAN